jgi:hypothetical protein
MDDVPRVMPPRRSEVMVADYDTELVVLVPDTRLTHHLDVGLSLILDACDGVTLSKDLINEIATATASDVAVVGGHILEALRQFESLDII